MIGSKSPSISEEDVYSVAKDLGIEVNEDQVKEVLELYPSEQEQDPTATWDLVVEEIIQRVTEID